MSRGNLAGLLLLAVSLAGWWVDARVLLASWLAAWWWSLGLVLGCFVNAWMHRLTGGAWGEALRSVALLLGRRMPWLLLALLPVLAGMGLLYPWAGEPQRAWLEAFSRPAFVRAWLSTPFFIARVAVYAIAWWWLTREASLERKGRAAASLAVHTVLSSLAAVDLLMSLLPGWYSTAFGLIVLAVQALGGAALAVLLVAWCLPRRLEADAARRLPLSRDLGNLLLMWSMTWAYLAFMQFLVIWAENLPREIAWYVPRLQTGWVDVAIALVLLQWLLPCVALLFRAVKDRPARLAPVAALLVAASALDVAWTVLPSVAPHSLHGWWLLPLTFCGMGLLLFGGIPAQLRERAGDTGFRVQHAGA
ncbi:hypothetical protein H4CHR_03235 [Variovorax sp. PBS-H4]|uniref:hypothetical protein n=1 Tax=Variovorax sp. PBS-H4 TaxID=434008 RepID=UPI0013169AE5|nr:hypothetical protein [Variovorax sp. PBS-H4]VTU33541.1 hypothetical protein H4CHR_03235 [Variovorax sp. PBS-H4]